MDFSGVFSSCDSNPEKGAFVRGALRNFVANCVKIDGRFGVLSPEIREV